MTVRLLLTPKWLGLTAVALLAIVVCGFAALWQWDRSQQAQQAEQASLAAELPIQEVLSPDQTSVPIDALGRQVRVVGRYIPGRQTFVRSRLSAQGEAGFWVVNGVRTQDGVTVAILRGWSPTTDLPAPQGDVAVEGRVQPDENFYPAAEISAREPLVTITSVGLQEQWANTSKASSVASKVSQVAPDKEVAGRFPGFVAATAIAPSSNRVQLVRPVIGGDPDVGFPLRNVLYSVQWLVFVGFAIVMWFRWFGEDRRDQRRQMEGRPKTPEPDQVSLDV